MGLSGVKFSDNGSNSHCTDEREGVNMQRSESETSEGFWKTIEILAGREKRRSSAADLDELVAALRNVPTAVPRSSFSFKHPHVRARLEKLMGTHLVRLTDKQYMTDLEDRIRDVYEENLNKRIANRVLDEMERLKRLILIGKTPLKECPPELYDHPVFVFWRMVNREVAKASRKRANAYYRKLKAAHKIEHNIMDEEAEAEAQEEAPQLTAEELLDKCRQELEQKRAEDIENGFCFTDAEFDELNYQTPDIKTLKTLSTVEEMYALADKIIGTKRLPHT